MSRGSPDAGLCAQGVSVLTLHVSLACARVVSCAMCALYVIAGGLSSNDHTTEGSDLLAGGVPGGVSAAGTRRKAVSDSNWIGHPRPPLRNRSAMEKLAKLVIRLSSSRWF